MQARRNTRGPVTVTGQLRREKRRDLRVEDGFSTFHMSEQRYLISAVKNETRSKQWNRSWIMKILDIRRVSGLLLYCFLVAQLGCETQTQSGTTYSGLTESSPV